jgi:hypothetical protein
MTGVGCRLPRTDHLDMRWSILRSPSSRARSVRACQGSQTAQSQTDARVSASVYVAFHSPTGVSTLD